MLLPIYEETAKTVAINPLIPQSWGTLGSWGTPPDSRPRLYRGTSYKKLYYLYMKRLLKQSLSTPQTPGPGIIEAPLSQRSHKYNWIYVSHIVTAVKYFSNFHALLRNGWLVFSNHKPLFAAIAGHPRGTAGDIDNGIGLTERESGWITSGLDMAGYIKRIITGRLNYYIRHSQESARFGFETAPFFIKPNRHLSHHFIFRKNIARVDS
jgi:hypothetical protein